jgi:hypothetical protein
MNETSPRERLHAAVDRVNETARQIRASSARLVDWNGGGQDPDGKAEQAAEVLARLSDSLERAGENAMASGLAVRDRSRDAARALSRSKRVLRDGGFRAAAAQVATHPRRRPLLLALGAGTVAALLLVGVGVSRST